MGFEDAVQAVHMIVMLRLGHTHVIAYLRLVHVIDFSWFEDGLDVIAVLSLRWCARLYKDVYVGLSKPLITWPCSWDLGQVVWSHRWEPYLVDISLFSWSLSSAALRYKSGVCDF